MNTRDSKRTNYSSKTGGLHIIGLVSALGAVVLVFILGSIVGTISWEARLMDMKNGTFYVLVKAPPDFKVARRFKVLKASIAEFSPPDWEVLAELEYESKEGVARTQRYYFQQRIGSAADPPLSKVRGISLVNDMENGRGEVAFTPLFPPLP